MSSNASEARRLRPDRRKCSKDHDISNQKYTCWDVQALHVDTNVAIANSMDTLTACSLECAEKRVIGGIELETVKLDGRTMLNVPGEQEEVEFGVIHRFAYELVLVEGQEGGELVVTTTSLETMLGDVAVAVHPDDPRYKDVIGRKLVHPFVVGRDVVVIGDKELVGKDIGTGAIQVTPARSQNGFSCGHRHSLPKITMLNDDGTIDERYGLRSAGMSRYRARREIIAALTELGLYRGSDKNPMTLRRYPPKNEIVEPRLLPQWWIYYDDFVERSAAGVHGRELRLIPETADATSFS
jgi:valyl-tRNA synthetase